MVTFGWKASPEQYPPREMLDYAVAAEDAGFDSLSVSDHFHPWSEAGQSCFTWSWLGAAAASLKRMELGTGVTCPILRYNPAIIAQAAATVDNMAPGRTYLGVGTGEALNEYPVMVEWPGFHERQDMLREALDLIRALWTGDEVTFQSEHYSMRKARLFTLPKAPIPIFISSLVPESAYYAGLYGDGLLTVGGNPPEVYEKMLSNFEAGARDAGKDSASMPKHIELSVAFTDDVEAAIAPVKKYWTGTMIHAMYLQKIYTPAMSAQNGSVVGDDVIKQNRLISADPEDHIRLAQKFIRMGFDRIYFGTAGPDERRFIEAYGRDVLPALRKASEQVATI